MSNQIKFLSILIFTLCFSSACVNSHIQRQSPSLHYHVAKTGSDKNLGTKQAPFLTISHAASIAQAGDTITVYEGVYREQVDPPRAGLSYQQPITYQAAPGESVTIMGSENIKGWRQVSDDVWKVTLSNQFFGDYNPYEVKIAGDWFIDNGRDHHTGAVYVDGHWLWEAPSLDLLLGDKASLELPKSQLKSSDNLFHLKHISIGEARFYQAAEASNRYGTSPFNSEEGDALVGDIRDGHWLHYKQIDFSEDAGFARVYAAADGTHSDGGVVEFRLNQPDGKLIAKVLVRPTSSWQDLRTFRNAIDEVTGIHDLYLVFRKPTEQSLEEAQIQVTKENAKLANKNLWFANVTKQETTIYAEFPGLDPNKKGIEINVRERLFYPSQPGINYITVRGFKMRNAATNWSPPTAQQVAALGTHWSKGWKIENNVISYSRSACLSLGKYGDEFDNKSANSATGYISTIERALSKGWNKENIGHHYVHNNIIEHCEQAGIVGSLGGAFSQISGNKLRLIHKQKLFDGYEMAAIKLHAPIDTVITGNQISESHRGIWLDWMSQGTRVSSNLFYNNDMQDLWLEVNHGPAVVDNNILLSKTAIEDWSQGTAFVHNLIAGNVVSRPVPERSTPFHFAHSTAIAGVNNIMGGDNRYYNNLFVNSDLSSYKSGMANYTNGNVFIEQAQSIKFENDTLIFSSSANEKIRMMPIELIDSNTLGLSKIAELPYLQSDGRLLKLNTDFWGQYRSANNSLPGPFDKIENEKIGLQK
jgi:hypothetical protein